MRRETGLMTAIVLLGLTTTGARCDTSKVEVKLETRVCAAGSGTIVKGEYCWVTDLKTGIRQHELQICVGLTINGGILVAGAEGKVMLCGTLNIPSEMARTKEDREAWKKVAEQRLRSYLLEPKNRESIGKKIGKTYRRVQVRAFRTADSATGRELEEAIKKSLQE
jgi:hypothetical protein